MTLIYINTRNLMMKSSAGVQRYTTELLKRQSFIVLPCSPTSRAEGLSGHIWEQRTLPNLVHDGLLWSPANTGPLSVRTQVVSMHDMATLDHPEWFDWKFARWYQVLLPNLARRAQRIITISEYSRHRICALTGISHAKVVVTPLAADARFQPASTAQQQMVRQRLGLPERYVLAVGSLEPRKNLARLFAAWQAWEDRPSGLALAVVGGQGKVFRNVGYEHVPNGVSLLGRVTDDDLPALYSAAEAFAYPSLYEGFGLPPLEAMACGTPVLTSSVTSLPEVVGNSAVLVQPEDVASILHGLRRIVSDAALQEELRGRGLARARRYSWDETASMTWDVLEREAGA